MNSMISGFLQIRLYPIYLVILFFYNILLLDSKETQENKNDILCPPIQFYIRRFGTTLSNYTDVLYDFAILQQIIEFREPLICLGPTHSLKIGYKVQALETR